MALFNVVICPCFTFVPHGSLTLDFTCFAFSEESVFFFLCAGSGRRILYRANLAYDLVVMEVTSTEVMQDTSVSHEIDDCASAAAAAVFWDGSVAKLKAENLGTEFPSKDLLCMNTSQYSPDIY